MKVILFIIILALIIIAISIVPNGNTYDAISETLKQNILNLGGSSASDGAVGEEIFNSILKTLDDKDSTYEIKLDENSNITPPLLKKNERLLFVCLAVFCKEHIRSVKDTSIGGTTIRLCKGVSFHTGKIQGESHREVSIEPEDSGTLFLTNKRLIFSGNGGTTYQINIKNILDMQSSDHDIIVHKENVEKGVMFRGLVSADFFEKAITKIYKNL